jgi:hypothetical protein
MNNANKLLDTKKIQRSNKIAQKAKIHHHSENQALAN